MYGSVIAYILQNCGYDVLVIDKRSHIGGNCYSYFDDYGIEIHKYGPHVFHTSNKKTWNFVNSITEFRSYFSKAMASYHGKLYNIPINLQTINDFFNLNMNPTEARKFIKSRQLKRKGNSIESWCISNIGVDLYCAFIQGYTKKQWDCDPDKLPEDIIKRLEIRYNCDSNYHNDLYSGIPIAGWNNFFYKLLEDIPFIPLVDYNKNKDKLNGMADKIIYTGPIDEYFDYSEGELSWRSLEFDVQYYSTEDLQGIPVINYPSLTTPYTRSVEYKHFQPGLKTNKTAVVFEKSCQNSSKPYYPINLKKDKKILLKYQELAKKEKNVFFGGRLAEYKYYNMDKIIEKVIDDVKIHCK